MKEFIKDLSLNLLDLIPDIPIMNHAINQLNYFRVHKRFSVKNRIENINDYIFSVKDSEFSSNFGYFIDKQKVKIFISRVFGEQYIIPTLGVFKDASSLSLFTCSERYVLKPTHMSQNILFKGGGKLTQQEVAQCSQWLKRNYFSRTREHNYRFLEPKIIVEPFIGEADDVPPDFKFYIVNGVCQLIQIDYGRFKDRSSDLYDPEWNKLNVKMRFPTSSNILHPNVHLFKMKALAEKMGAFFEFVRVDLYSTKEGIKFSEYTFTPCNASLYFEPFGLAETLYEKIKTTR